MTLRVGTRSSALALTQARIVADALGGDVELVPVRTHGDVSARPLRELGDGVFVSALEDALRAREIDVAVHSLKDLPTDDRPGLALGAVLAREDPRDVLLAEERRGLRVLPRRPRIGTGSPRRAAFLRALRPDARAVDIRGNVDTRIRKLREGEYDAIVVALAALRRIAFAVADDEILSLEDMPPAPGQGALAAQCRAEDERARAALAAIDDASVRAATDAERSLLRALGGSCLVPLGAFASVADEEISLEAALAIDGVRRVRERGRDPVAVGERAAQALREIVHA